MMLYKLSLKNIRKSIKDYAIYFFTLILGVAIFYVFNAIESQTVMLNVNNTTAEIIDLLSNILSGLSVFVSIVLGALIIYASRFLIKRRNKEFGIYLTLGMSKRKMSWILFIETLIVGIISLFVGLGLGVLLSQFMSIIVANMFEADMSRFTFVFSSKAFIKTMIYFSIIYLLVMIFNTLMVGKCKLIDLLNGSKRGEKIKLRNPYICLIVFIISCGCLSYAYYLVTGGINTIMTETGIFKPIIIGAVSTFFIFWSLSGLLLRIFLSLKKVYYKGLNSFTLRQFSSKINTMVLSMTIICLMLFITICLLSSAFSMKNSMTANLNKLAAADIEISKKINLDESWLSDGKEKYFERSHVDILDTLKSINVDINDYLSDYINVNVYKTKDLTLGDTLGSKIDELKSMFAFISYDDLEEIMKISDYNKVAKLYGNKTYSLNDDEYMIISDYEGMAKLRNVALENNEKIVIFNHELKPKYTKCQPGLLIMSGTHSNSGIIVVSDTVIDETYLASNYIIGNYKADSKKDKEKMEEKLLSYFDKLSLEDKTLLSNNTKIDITNACVGLGALVTFIALYLGIIFLISSAAILALKELSESVDNIERFSILRKIGASEKMLNKALFRQIGIFFLFPLLLAIIHSIFGLKFAYKILETFGTDKLFESIIMCVIFILIIYGGYFLITYFSSKSIIKEKR